MPAKIRLQRKGKKGQPFYHIIIADGRAPRDGKFIERIGTYNPLSKPAEIDMKITGPYIGSRPVQYPPIRYVHYYPLKV